MSTSTVLPGVNKEEWTQATDKAKEAAASVGQMASHAVSAAEGLASEAACNVWQSADQLAADAGAGIHQFGNSLGRSLPHSGVLGTAAQSLAGAVQHSGEYLEDQKLSGMAKDVTHLIRRNPIPSVLISIGIGWFVARKMWK